MLLKVVRSFLGTDAEAPDIQIALNRERFLRLTGMQLVIVFAYVSLSLLISVYARNAGAPPQVWLYTIPALATAAASAASWFYTRKHQTKVRVRKNSILFISIAILLSGAMWGTTLAAMANITPDGEIIFVLVAVGLASISVTLTVAFPLASFLFVVVCVTPPLVVCLLAQPHLFGVLFGLYTIYLLTNGYAIGISFKALLMNIETRVENGALLKAANVANSSKSNFIGSMSHELRTPLNAISGYAQLVKLDGKMKDGKKVDRTMDNILEASLHLTKLIDDVLEISKLETGNLTYSPVVLTPSEVFRETLPMVRELVGNKNLKFEGVKKSGKFISVDPMRLKQVFLNLIGNAIKYTLPGGSFEFGCYEIPGNLLRIYVSDTGIGIPEKDQDKIFGQFHRAANTINLYPGTGLGLHHSKRLVEEMGGLLSFESVEAGGTTFYMDFEICPDAESDSE